MSVVENIEKKLKNVITDGVASSVSLTNYALKLHDDLEKHTSKLVKLFNCEDFDDPAFLRDWRVHATFFMNGRIPPPKSLAPYLERHDMGIHLYCLNELQNVRSFFEREFGKTFDKLAPHTINFFEDNEQRLREVAVKSRFRILSGNAQPPLRPIEELGPEKIDSGTYYFREFWLTREGPMVCPYDSKRLDLEWLLAHEKGNTIVVCTHELELAGKLDGTENTRRKLELIFTRCDVMNFQEWLDTKREI